MNNKYNCKYCEGTGQRDWVDVMTGKIPEIKMKSINQLIRAWLGVIKTNRNNRRYPAKMFNTLKHGTPLGTMQKLYSHHINPIDFNTWTVRVKK